MFKGFCRLARESDLPALAELRFLADRQSALEPPAEKALFVEDFLRIAGARPCGEVLHWVLELDGAIVATRSAIIIRELPEPGSLSGRAAWVSRCYRRASSSGAAAPARLLSAIEDWALREGVELIHARETSPTRGRGMRSEPDRRHHQGLALRGAA